jgi:hypothetical protein
LLAILGRPISAETVSQVAKTLDVAVAAFHRRPLQNRYQVLMLDGVVLARKTGAGAPRRPVLVALGRAKRRSSTSAWRRAKAPPNGRSSSPIFTVTGSPARASTWSASMVAAACWLPCRSSCTAFPCSAAGSQDQEHLRQSPQGRPAQRQARTPQGHACPQSTCRTLGRSSVRRSLRGRATPMRLHACGTTSTNCSPASATNPRSNVEGTNHHRHRTTLPRSPTTD